MGPHELRRAVLLLQAGDWQAAHQIVQQDEASPLACWAHGIVHLMEGDVPNARYWYGQARRAFPISLPSRTRSPRWKKNRALTANRLDQPKRRQ